MAKNKFYVVWKGRQIGVFSNWDSCKMQIEGFKGAQYKSFDSLEQAQKALAMDYWQYVADVKKESATRPLEECKGVIANSLAVDAACSGNPGPMEYQGVRTYDKERMFHVKFELGTNNIGEFLALVHGLSYLKKHNIAVGKEYPVLHPVVCLAVHKNAVFPAAENAISWVKQKKCKTKLDRNEKTEELFKYIDRAEAWLKTNTYTTQILKWDTDNWGEIPADFNRK